MVANNRGEHRRAKEIFEELIELGSETGDTWHLGLALVNLGSALLGLGEFAVAGRRYREALELSQHWLEPGLVLAYALPSWRFTRIGIAIGRTQSDVAFAAPLAVLVR